MDRHQRITANFFHNVSSAWGRNFADFRAAQVAETANEEHKREPDTTVFILS
jgi:hypothetical protein